MTTNLYLDDYENVEITGTAHAGRLGTEPFFTLTVTQNTPGYGSNAAIFFVNFKDREDFADRLYAAIVSLRTPGTGATEASGGEEK